MRASWVSFVPQEWKDREKEGLCPVCGIHHDAFEPGMKKFCSPKCRKIYSDKLIFWNSLREDALERDNYTCQICGMNQEKVEQQWIRNKQDWHNENIEYVLKNGSDAIEEERNDLEKTIQGYLDSIYERLELLADERKLAEWVIRVSSLNKFGLKLPHDEYSYKPQIVLEVDHRIAIANGGDRWSLDNLQTLCHECHAKKTNKDMIKHRAKKKGLVTLDEVEE